MDDPNSFSRVKLINNPVKSYVIEHTFSENDSTVRCRLDPRFIDVRQGVWQVALSDILLVNNSTNRLNTVFDLKTNLSYTCQVINHESITVNECLASVETQCKAEGFVFHVPNNIIFFTVMDASTESFNLSLTRKKILEEPKAFSVKAEVRLLFQRMI